MQNNNKFLSDSEQTDKDIFISVIVPVYNLDAHLEKCLSSLLKQTLDKKLYEVIIVDDSSTDFSSEIIESFCLTNENFRSIKLTSHSVGGSGIPLNFGIKSARGKYIVFLDGDDSASPSMLEDLLEKAIDTCSDVVFATYLVKDLHTGEILPPFDEKIFNRILTTSQTKKETDHTIRQQLLKLSPMVWRKLYSMDLIKKNDIYFPEVDIYHEDWLFTWKVVISAKKIALVNKALVLYSINREHQMTSTKNESRDPNSYLYIAQYLFNYLHEKNIFYIYKISYLDWLLIHMKASTRNFFPGYIDFIRQVSLLIPKLDFKDLFELQKFRSERKNQILFSWAFLIGFPKFSMISRTSMLTLKYFFKKRFFNHF